MKRVLIAALALALVTIASLGLAGAVAAEQSEARVAPAAGLRWGRAHDVVRRGAWVVSETLSTVLGLGAEEIREARMTAGTSLADIVRGQYSLDGETLAERIEAAVESGALSSEQAAWLLSRAEGVCERLANPFAPGGPHEHMRDGYSGRFADRMGR